MFEFNLLKIDVNQIYFGGTEAHPCKDIALVRQRC